MPLPDLGPATFCIRHRIVIFVVVMFSSTVWSRKEMGPKNRLTTHNIAPYSHLMFAYVDDRRHAFIEPISIKKKQFLIRVRRHVSLTHALVCADRNDGLKLRRGSPKFIKSRECRWTQHQVRFNKRKSRQRRKRRDLLSPNAYRYESKYGAFLSVTLSGNITLVRSQGRDTRFRLNETPVHRK